MDIEKETKAILKREVIKQMKDFNLHYMIEDVIEEVLKGMVEDILDKKLSEGDNLNQMVFNSAKSETIMWIDNNIEKEQMIEIIKESMVEKLKELSFEQIREIVDKVKIANP